MNYKLWFLIEYCNGGDLNNYILNNMKKMDHNYHIIKQLIQGLQFLHKVGMIRHIRWVLADKEQTFPVTE